MNGQLLVRDDSDLVEVLTENLKSKGANVLTGRKVTKVSQSGSEITVTFADKNNELGSVISESVLVAVGRAPNIEGLNLEKAQVEYTRKGIVTDKKLRTTAKNIYACGDVTSPYQFSHMAEYQAIVATSNAFFPWKRSVNYDNLIWVTFSDPALASCGLNERTAREKYGDTIKVYRYDYSSLDRAVVDQNEIGFGKFICDKKGKILGAHILGSRAGELIHEVQLGKAYGISFTNFQSVVHAYPTYSELVKKASRLCYVDRLRNNFFIKLIQIFMSKKRGKNEEK